MRNYPVLLALFAFMFFAKNADAQVRVTKGDIKVLKGHKSVGVKFTYENMAVGKYKKEQDYVDKKIEDGNKDEAGKGDEWKESWYNDRSARFQPKFLDLINKYTDKAGTNFTEKTEGTKYTLIVNTDFTEPGFNAFVVKKYAEIRTTVKIVETDNPDKVIATMSVAGVGRTYGYGDLDTGTRIAEAYAKAGKDFGKYLAKKALK